MIGCSSGRLTDFFPSLRNTDIVLAIIVKLNLSAGEGISCIQHLHWGQTLQIPIATAMETLHPSTEERMAAVIDAPASKEDAKRRPEQSQFGRVASAEDDDDLALLKLGYKSVLARGWGAFDNFACTFSALNCIGGIRVLFYISLSGGGPAAM